MDQETLDIVAKMYELVVEARVHKVLSIKVAEAAKVIGNAQRNVNIAFMNELSVSFNRLDIDTKNIKNYRTSMGFYEIFSWYCIEVDSY